MQKGSIPLFYALFCRGGNEKGSLAREWANSAKRATKKENFWESFSVSLLRPGWGGRVYFHGDEAVINCWCRPSNCPAMLRWVRNQSNETG
jgi:hypothetical protein